MDIDNREFSHIHFAEGWTMADQTYIEGETLFPAPWRVDEVGPDANKRIWYMVVAANGRTILNPDLRHTKNFCMAVVHARNEVTDQQCLQAMEARMRQGIAGAADQVDRVRAHFHDEMDKLQKANDYLRNAIANAKKSGSIDDLPNWCVADEDEFLRPTPKKSTAKEKKK